MGLEEKEKEGRAEKEGRKKEEGPAHLSINMCLSGKGRRRRQTLHTATRRDHENTISLSHQKENISLCICLLDIWSDWEEGRTGWGMFSPCLYVSQTIMDSHSLSLSLCLPVYLYVSHLSPGRRRHFWRRQLFHALLPAPPRCTCLPFNAPPRTVFIPYAPPTFACIILCVCLCSRTPAHMRRTFYARCFIFILHSFLFLFHAHCAFCILLFLFHLSVCYRAFLCTTTFPARLGTGHHGTAEEPGSLCVPYLSLQEGRPILRGDHPALEEKRSCVIYALRSLRQTALTMPLPCSRLPSGHGRLPMPGHTGGREEGSVSLCYLCLGRKEEEGGNTAAGGEQPHLETAFLPAGVR